MIVNFIVSIIVHLPLIVCQLRCYFFNEYNYQQFLGQMKGNSYPNVEVFQKDKLEWNHLLLTEPKKKRKWRELFVIFMFIANNSIF